MKRKLLILPTVLLLLLVTLVLGACGQWDDPYKQLDKDGSTVSVKFLAGEGGMFAGTNGVTVVDVFDLSDYAAVGGKVSIPLLEPSDEDRGNNAFEISRSGHALAGWFVAETVKNADGEELDEDGELCSVSGKPAAYETGKKWDFATDRLTLTADGKYSSATPELMLMAVWIPYVNFEFYDGDTLIGSYDGLYVDMPEWDMSTGKLNYKSFPSVDGKTLVSAFLDKEMQIPMTERVEGKFDYETGTSLTPVIKIYTTWREGEWFKISTPQQLTKNATPAGCYEILADLDFSKAAWPAAFVNNAFTGKIEGNGHKISGVKMNANITKGGDVSHGALFGSLGEGANISDLSFENITYTVQSPGIKAASTLLGVLAGKNAGAVLEDVTVASSKIVLVKTMTTMFEAQLSGDDQTVTIGLIFAEGDTASIDYSGITVEVEDENIVVTVGEGGILSFAYPS